MVSTRSKIHLVRYEVRYIGVVRLIHYTLTSGEMFVDNDSSIDMGVIIASLNVSIYNCKLFGFILALFVSTCGVQMLFPSRAVLP